MPSIRVFPAPEPQHHHRTRRRIRGVTDLHQELISVLGSVRLEDALPDREVIELGEAWARGELTADDLDAAAKRLAAGQPPWPRPATAA